MIMFGLNEWTKVIKNDLRIRPEDKARGVIKQHFSKRLNILQ